MRIAAGSGCSFPSALRTSPTISRSSSSSPRSTTSCIGPSPGRSPISPSMPLRGEVTGASGATHLLLEARREEESGSIANAVTRYGAAIAAAADDQEPALLAEALRRLAVVLHQRDETDRAWELCRQS